MNILLRKQPPPKQVYDNRLELFHTFATENAMLLSLIGSDASIRSLGSA